MKLRQSDPWMPAPDYSRTLRGIGFNLLVRDVDRSLAFLRDVLGLEVVYSDPDFAVVRGVGGEFMLHADHTYERHPLLGRAGEGGRGSGVELRIYGTDPDIAVARARREGFEVLADAMDKGHGLREAYIVDHDGYTWVPGRMVDAKPAP